nr:bifunctional oligoribonuclease/PAP phosphatase NrnA [Sedimentibacter sp.]
MTKQVEKMTMKLNLNDVKEIFDIINESNNICIAGHKGPDGDCIGSVMALYELLKPTGKNLTICFDGLIPYNYKTFVDEDALSKGYDGSKYDAVVVLDCSDIERLGKFSDILNNTKKTICIDHHKTNLKFADINIIDMDISSTGELLYNVIVSAGKEKDITAKIAEFIYIAILTDTGKFSYSSTSANTHKVVANLMDKGIDVSEIDNLIYNSKPSAVVKAYIECISGISLFFDNKLGIASISQKTLTENNVEMGDIDGVVEFIREIKEVEVSCVLKEYKNNTKVSLRSKNNIDVSQISLKYGGGGHAKAAGFEVNDDVESTKKLIIDEFRKYFGE